MSAIICGDCGGDLIENPAHGPGRQVVTEHSHGRLVTVYDVSFYLHADDESPQCAGRADADRRRAARTGE